MSEETELVESGLLISKTEIMHPLSGEVLDISHTDGLISAYQELGRVRRMISDAEYFIKAAMAALATEGGKTRRIAGEKHTAKLTMPDQKWDNAELKRLWERFPDLREKYLRIDRVAPNMVEVNKLDGTACDGELLTFKALLLAAKQTSDALPTVTVES